MIVIDVSNRSIAKDTCCCLRKRLRRRRRLLFRLPKVNFKRSCYYDRCYQYHCYYDEDEDEEDDEVAKEKLAAWCLNEGNV